MQSLNRHSFHTTTSVLLLPGQGHRVAPDVLCKYGAIIIRFRSKRKDHVLIPTASEEISRPLGISKSLQCRSIGQTPGSGYAESCRWLKGFCRQSIIITDPLGRPVQIRPQGGVPLEFFGGSLNRYMPKTAQKSSKRETL